MRKEKRAVKLTKDMVRMNTINPPGNEDKCAFYLGKILENMGFNVKYYELDKGRSSLVARIGGSSERLPLCFTGHLDTVPLGATPWVREPFSGETDGDKFFGRGTSDMKSGIAAFVSAINDMEKKLERSPGLELVLTAGEETGCEGAFKLASSPGALGKVGAVLVGEPTANYPFIGHKGAYWLRATTKGVTAHGSMPEKGVNAAYKGAKALSALENFQFDNHPHKIMGQATLNVGTVESGLNINSVPDEMNIGIDVRTVPSSAHNDIKKSLVNLLGPDVSLETLLDVGSVFTEPENGWVQEVYGIMASFSEERPISRAATYFTDAAALNSAYEHPPTIILGPGEPGMAHQTDEYCYLSSIEKAVQVYEQIVKQYCNL